jgi:hypothetical protein
MKRTTFFDIGIIVKARKRLSVRMATTHDTRKASD